MTRTVVQETFDRFMKSAGFAKRSGSWYRSSDEVVTVVELQKSQYGPKYYINLGLWLRALGESTAPKEQSCHVRTRLSSLVGAKEEDQLASLLDAGSGLSQSEQRDDLWSFLEAWLAPAISACDSVSRLRSGDGQRVVSAALVTGPAQRLLA